MLFSFLTLLATTSTSSAQQFLDPLPVPMGPSATATLPDGSTVSGDPKIKAKGIGNIKKVTLKLEDGSKRKLGATDVVELRLVPGGLAKAMGAANAMSSVVEATKTDAGEVLNRNEALFVAGVLPNGKPALLQVLNPGFDATMRVFPDPAGRETASVGVGGVTVAGGGAKAYLVQKVGQSGSVLVKKGQYEELWDSLFGDCAAVAKPTNLEWGSMAADVKAHSAACGPTASAATPAVSEVPPETPEASEAPEAPPETPEAPPESP